METVNLTELLKNIGPLAGLVIMCWAFYKLFSIENAGKKFVNLMKLNKLEIAEIILGMLAFLEGVLAANMGGEVTGDTYATRFANHMGLSIAGAYAGFICIKEVIDWVSKINEKKYTFIYLTIQFLQAAIYFVIAAAMPIFNLMIIAKGVGDYDRLVYLVPWGDYPMAQVFGSLSDVTARSVLVVGAHILLTAAVALGSVDDVKSPEKKDKEDKKDKTNKSPKEKQLDRVLTQEERDEYIEIMAKALGDVSVPDIVNNLAPIVEKALSGDNAASIRYKGIMERLKKYGDYFTKNQRDLAVARDSGNQEQEEKAKKQITKTTQNMLNLWDKIRQK
jgi:hypothetical protein